MRILDLRPCWVRWALAAWRRSSERLDETSALGSGLGLADAWIERRARRRDPAPSSGPWLISIGNLALGGTGKTPVTGKLAADLALRGHRGAVLVRGYGSPLRGPLRVEPETPQAGDEARWHAAALAGSSWWVCQARSRPEGLRWLLRQDPNLDYVLLEDAHQTARLPRHLDILLLDRWRTADDRVEPTLQPATGPIFPWGPWRESAAGAGRADYLLIESGAQVPARSVDGLPVGTFARSLRLVAPLGEGPADPELPWAAVSGIAHPERFEAGARTMLSGQLRLAVRGGDHQRYDPAIVGRIGEEMRKAGAELLVTTAKDWVKLAPLWPVGRPARVVDLDLAWGKRNALPDWIEERVGSLSAKRSP